jgi:hypothetical protein
MQASDKSIVCKTCSKLFLCTVKEQEFFVLKGFAEPKVCRECRNLRKTTIEKRSATTSSHGKNINISAPSEISKGEKRRNDGEENNIKPERDSSNNQDSKRIRTDSNRDLFDKERETDPVRIEQRLKQIQYGYNSAAYDNYTASVPKSKRIFGDDNHPRTPDAYAVQSKRAFEGRIKKWRRDLHKWDLPGSKDEPDEFGSETKEPLSSELDSGAHIFSSSSAIKLSAEYKTSTAIGVRLNAADSFAEVKKENIVSVSAGSESDADEDDVL